MKFICWNLLVLAVGILLIELYFGGWIESSNGTQHLNIITDLKRQMDVCDIYERPDGFCTITYTRDRHGLRGRYSDTKNIDILTMGGSTTDQRYVSDDETWQAVLSRRFSENGQHISVVNAGVDGQSSYGHLVNFEQWLPRIEGLRPRFILYYVGINDFYKPAGNTPQDDKDWRQQLRKKSAIYYLYRTLKGMYLSTKNEVGHRRIDFDKLEWVNKGLVEVPYSELTAPRVNAYRARLHQLAVRTRELGAEPIFVNQQSGYSRVVERQRIGVANINHTFRSHRYNGVDRYYMEKEFSDATMEVCREVGAICLNLASELEFQEGDFYDFLHNTPAGAERTGAYLYEKLKNIVN